ncbi:MAG: hypothetical protein FJ088_12025 [Deltaproteobacteria bacterium]|nr:hypothetical protein [Deltaproteobacteria bacterium]
MKKITAVAAFCAIVSGMIPLAGARDVGGKLGIGYDQSLGGVSGLSVKYWIDNLGIWTTFGFDYFNPDGDGDSLVEIEAALGVIYNFVRPEEANLGIGLRGDLGFLNKAANNNTERTFHFNIEVPIVAEYFFSDHFAVHASTGFIFVLVPSSGAALTPQKSGILQSQAKGFGFGIGHGNLFANAGFTFYF